MLITDYVLETHPNKIIGIAGMANGYDAIRWKDTPIPENQLLDEIAVVQKTQMIKALRDEKWQGGWLVGGDWFHSNELSKINYLSAKDQPDNWELPKWSTMRSGVKVTMTADLAKQILDIGNLQINTGHFVVADTHIAQLEASDNPQEYDFTTSPEWPDTYQEWIAKEQSNA